MSSLKDGEIEAVFTIKDLKKQYPGTKEPALQIDQMSIPKGQFITILGNSGCGKTTLFRLLGLLDTPSDVKEKNTTISFHPNTGETVEYYEEQNKNRVMGRTAAELRKNQFGFLFQDEYLLNHLNVLNNIEIPMLLKGVPKSERVERSQKLLSILELSEKTENGKKPPFLLSKGERQRVALMRSCLHDPEVILADEPTGNLDNLNASWVFQLLSFWQGLDPERRTVIVITHDIQRALEYSDSLLLFNKQYEYLQILNLKGVQEKKAKIALVLYRLLNASNKKVWEKYSELLPRLVKVESKSADLETEGTKKNADNPASQDHPDSSQKIYKKLEKYSADLNSIFQVHPDNSKLNSWKEWLFINGYAFSELKERPKRLVMTMGTLILLIFLTVFLGGLLNGTKNYLSKTVSDPTIGGITVEIGDNSIIDGEIIEEVRKATIQKQEKGSFQIIYEVNAEKYIFPEVWGHLSLGLKILKSDKKQSKTKDNIVTTFGITVLREDSLVSKSKPISGQQILNNDANGIYISSGLAKRLGFNDFQRALTEGVTFLYGMENHPLSFPVIGVSKQMDKEFYVTEGFTYRWFEGEYDPGARIGRFMFNGFSHEKEAKDYQNLVKEYFDTTRIGNYRIESIFCSRQNNCSFSVSTRFRKVASKSIIEGKYPKIQKEWYEKSPNVTYKIPDDPDKFEKDFQKQFPDSVKNKVYESEKVFREGMLLYLSPPANKNKRSLDQLVLASQLPALHIPKQVLTPFEPDQLEYSYLKVYPHPEYLKLEIMEAARASLLEKFDLNMELSEIHKIIQISEINGVITGLGEIFRLTLLGFSFLIIFLTFSESISQKYKKLGVQKSMGLRGSQIILIYSIQAFYIWFFSVVVVLILSAIIYLVYLMIPPDLEIIREIDIKSFFLIDLMDIFLIGLTTFVVSLTAAFVVTRGFAFQKPADLLLDKE